MAQALRDVIRGRLEGRFVGRLKELETLLSCLADDGPLVVHVHGFAGAGKTTLLRRFALEAERLGSTVINLDCGDIEPTERGFLAALAEAIGVSELSLADLTDTFSGGDRPIVFLLDDYQHIYLADTWVRQRLLAALPAHARVVIASREPPLPGWSLSPEWRDCFASLALGPLTDEEALDLAQRMGLPLDQARSANRVALGYPLAIELAVNSAVSNAMRLEALTLEASIQRLAELHLSELRDKTMREALEASSVIRRITVPLLAALLPEADATGLYDRLQALPYVERVKDGLVLHAAVQRAIASSLRAADPERHRRYREAAWRRLRAHSRSAGVADMWRYTADMIYLIENPLIREAFFPTMLEPLSSEKATPDDWTAIERIAAEHEPPAACAIIGHWWRSNPDAFTVMRAQTGQVKGFYVFVEPGSLSPVPDDPIFSAWRRHLRDAPIARNENVVFVRRWLSEGEGELPSSVQGTCWLSVKQSYMALRPHLRRCYIAVSDLETYGPVATALGFRLVEGASAEMDGKAYHLAVLDMGPGSVDGWLSAHIARELGLDEVGVLDLRSHELVLDGARTHLTPLEFETLRFLAGHLDEAVSRASLLESVWGYEYSGDSNVVDTIIAGLRRKLGESAALIETVWGVGYRLRLRPGR